MVLTTFFFQYFYYKLILILLLLGIATRRETLASRFARQKTLGSHFVKQKKSRSVYSYFPFNLGTDGHMLFINGSMRWANKLIWLSKFGQL